MWEEIVSYSMGFWDKLVSGLQIVGVGVVTSWNFFLLVLGYGLIWFLGGAALMLFKGKGPSMHLPMAMVMGLFTALLHIIVCHFIANPCKL